MNTRREFLQQAAFLSLMGGFGTISKELNAKEKPQCTEEQLESFERKHIPWQRKTEKVFEFPQATVTIGLVQHGCEATGPGHRYYYSYTISRCGEAVKVDQIVCDLDDCEKLYDAGPPETYAKRHDVPPAFAGMLIRRRAVQHLYDLANETLGEAEWAMRPIEGFTNLRYKGGAWGTGSENEHRLKALREFAWLLVTTINDLSRPDCIREEPWT